MKETVRIGDICDILNGYAFKSNEYTANGIRIIRIANVQKGYVEDLAPQFYPLLFQNEINKYMLYEGDLLVSLTGNVGRVALLPFDMLPAALNQRVACLRVKDSSKLEKSFLFYLLNTSCFERKCVEASKGVAQKNLSTEWLKNYEISLPSIQEQRRISSLLGEIDAIVHLYQQQLAKLDELVKARFIEMFGSVENNVLGIETIKIKDACNLINGKAFKPEDWSDEGLPIVRIQNLNDDKAPFNFFKGKIKEQYLIDNGELLFSWSGTPGTSFGAFFWNRGKAVLNQHIFRVQPKVPFNLFFLQFALNGRIDYIISKAHGGVGLQHITKKDLDDVELLLPGINLQNQFAAFVTQVEKAKSAVQKALDKAQLLFDSLMQTYFG